MQASASTELQFRRLLDMLPAAAYTCDAAGLITYCNQTAARLWGRSPKLNDPQDRFCGSFKLYSTDGTPIRHDECWMAQALKHGQEYNGQEYNGQEIIIEREDGSRITALAHANPIRDEAGNLVGAMNVLVDITDRREAEKAKALLATIIESSADAIYSRTLDGRILSWNAGAQRLFGYTASEIIGASIELLIPPDKRQEEQDFLEKLCRYERIEHFETVRLHKQGRRIHVSLAMSPIRDGAGRIIGASKVTRDITARKQAETALLESQQRFAQFMDHLPGVAWIKDLEGRYVFVNNAGERMYGRSREELYGQYDEAIFSPQAAAKFRETDHQALVKEQGIEAIESLEYIDGVHHAIVSKFPIPGPDGRPALVGGMAIDITQRVRIEDALRESEERFRALAMNSPAAIFIKDLAGRYTLANPLACQALGRPDGVVGLTDYDLLPHDVAEQLCKHDQEVIATGTSLEREEVVRGEGFDRDFLAVKFPLLDADGQPTGVCGVAVDISERKATEIAVMALKDELATQLADMRRLHEMSVRLSKTLEVQPILMETLRTAVAIEGTSFGLLSLYDPETNRLQVGASVGFDEAFLQQIANIVPGAGACGLCFQERRRVIIEDTEADPSFAPFREAARQAGFRSVHSTPLTTRSGKILGVLSTHFSEPHRPSDRETHLIDLCARQAVDFIENAQLYVQLREADRRKDEFLATLAHELRNPLAPICNSLQILRLSDELNPAVERMREIMERQVNHMIRLVDDLLEVSRITRGKIELRKEPVELAAIIRSAVETSRPLIESAGHQLAITLSTEPMTLEADPVRLAQVISNLLNNAAKYTDQGGQIWLTVRREESTALISVRDTGVGISSEMLPRVFDMFAQVDHSLNRAQGGLGIGLTLAKSLVQLHGGSIEARSTGPGQGSEFMVRLPLALEAADQKTSASPLASQKTLPGRRILVVDDARDSAFILGKLLEKMGQQVRIAYDASMALEQVQLERPEVVISDIAMPRMDGYELAARLSSELGPDGVVLVALTGYGQDGDRQRAKEAGFHHHLVKPVSIEALQELLATLSEPDTMGQARLPR